MQIPENSVVMGVPASVKKNKNNFIQNRFNAFMYEINGQAYSKGEYRAWEGKTFQKKAEKQMKLIIDEFEKINNV